MFFFYIFKFKDRVKVALDKIQEDQNDINLLVQKFLERSSLKSLESKIKEVKDENK